MTSRHDLLAWINDTLGVNYSKVEHFASGAAACQICDVIWPGSVPMKKVKFDAKHEHEYVANYKVLQQVFTKKGVEKVIPVSTLVKGKFQENLMFAQWLKTFFDQRYGGNEYDATKRRKEAGGSAPSGAPRRAATKSAITSTTRAPVKTNVRSTAAKTTAGARVSKTVANDQYMDQLTQELAEVKVTTEGLEKERDFYFEKLRQIEILCDDELVDNAADLKTKIRDVLYAVEPGFQPPDVDTEEAAAAALEDEEF